MIWIANPFLVRWPGKQKIERKQYKMFHAKEGWFFERVVDGGTHILKKAMPTDDAPVVTEIYLTHDEWSSVIASVAAGGETSKKFEEAKIFHGHAPSQPAAPLLAKQFELEKKDQRTAIDWLRMNGVHKANCVPGRSCECGLAELIGNP